MNGAASAEKIFKLLAAEEPADGDRVPGENTTLKLEHVTFGYEKDRTILNDVSFTIPQGSFVSLVGESGCGKSTIAALLSGSRTGYTGSVTLGGVPVQELQQEQRLRTLTLVPHNAAALVIEAFVLLAETPLYGLWTGIITALIILYNFAGVQNIECKLYPGARHELLVETNHQEVFEDIGSWLEKHLA